jgi:hypothetical protein
MMEEDRHALEKLGYSFEVMEQPLTEPGKQGSYYRVAIHHGGLRLGTRSELHQERALARAYSFARRHSEGADPRKIVG